MFSVYPESTDISTSDYSEIKVMTSTRSAIKKDLEGKGAEEKGNEPVTLEEIEQLPDEEDVDTELTDADAIDQRDVIKNLNEELRKSKIEITKARKQAKVNSNELARLNAMVAKLQSRGTTTNLTGKSNIRSSISGKKLGAPKSKESLKALLKKAQQRGFKVTRKHIAIASTDRVQSKMSREEVSKLRESLVSYSSNHDVVTHKRRSDKDIRSFSTTKKTRADDDEQKEEDEDDEIEEEEEINHQLEDGKSKLKKDDDNFDDYHGKDRNNGPGITA
jgi:hypothetical protein